MAGHTYESILLKRRRKNRIFSELEALKILAQLLPVLHYLHKRNIIHRDISPNNLMRAKDRPRPVLIDFGLVKHFRDEKMLARPSWRASEDIRRQNKCFTASVIPRVTFMR